MVWVSGYKLAVAVSNAGGLGLVGAGSMKPDLLREHLQKARSKTDKPFGVNIPLLRGDALELIDVVVAEGVKIVFTSAGHPGKFIEKLKKANCAVIHVILSVKNALKAQSVGCVAVDSEVVGQPALPLWSQLLDRVRPELLGRKEYKNEVGVVRPHLGYEGKGLVRVRGCQRVEIDRV